MGRPVYRKAVPAPRPGGALGVYYGYGWWLHEIGTYAAHGRYGQYIFVVPVADVVVVFTSGLDDADAQEPELLLNEFVLPAVVPAESSE